MHTSAHCAITSTNVPMEAEWPLPPNQTWPLYFHDDGDIWITGLQVEATGTWCHCVQGSWVLCSRRCWQTAPSLLGVVTSSDWRCLPTASQPRAMRAQPRPTDEETTYSPAVHLFSPSLSTDSPPPLQHTPQRYMSTDQWLKHRRSQGVQWVKVHPQGKKWKIWEFNLEGKL